MADDLSKVFIDEDWKARAQREKEELQKRVEAESRGARPAVSDAAAATTPSEASVPGDGTEEMEEPYEANFDALLTSLATQTMFALGLIPQGNSEQVMVNLDQAKFTIDILAMLREKTKGNLAPEEQAALDETLTELQRLFVTRIHQFEQQAMRQAGIDPNNLRGELPQ